MDVGGQAELAALRLAPGRRPRARPTRVVLFALGSGAASPLPCPSASSGPGASSRASAGVSGVAGVVGLSSPGGTFPNPDDLAMADDLRNEGLVSLRALERGA